MTLVIEDLPFTSPSNTFFKNASANPGYFAILLLACTLSRPTKRRFSKTGRASLEHGVWLEALPLKISSAAASVFQT